MAVDENEEDFIYFGTPIVREEDTSTRKRKAAADAGQLRALPAWKQDVRDEEGRRRFHGAFTGGFSAGYYNTVGSKEGWAPQSFTSSRKNRSEVKKQSIFNFLDEDEKEEMDGHALGTSSGFDTFGFTAAEMSRKQAKKDQEQRPSVIPGPVPDEIVLPAMSSIGVKLLLKMGWRRGHSINDTHASLYGSRREARKAFLAFSGGNGKLETVESSSTGVKFDDYKEGKNDDDDSSQSTPVFVLNPKQDLHGLGFDPFRHAPEFRERKRSQTSKSEHAGQKGTASWKEKLFTSNSGKFAPGIGIGALEELDIEDEDIYDSGFEIQETCTDENEPDSEIRKDVNSLLFNKAKDLLFGFKPATNSEYKLERFRPPDIPIDFKAQHKFSAVLDASVAFGDSPPLEVPPPNDNNQRLLIEGFAALVSRCGRLFEDLCKEKNKHNPLFSFLYGQSCSDYYARKLWEERQKRGVQKKLLLDIKSSSLSDTHKMSVESRGRALGEKPLEKSSCNSTSAVSLPSLPTQSNLSSTFTEPSPNICLSKFGKPFKDNPPKQERFERFLKDKFEGGLRSSSSGGTSSWSENDRARERLDFEAVVEKIQKEASIEQLSQPAVQEIPSFPMTVQTQFISGGTEMNMYPPIEEKKPAENFPQREEFQWRPAPVLCKRFDISDPYMGKPPPMPKPRSKMDSFVFTSDFIKGEKLEPTVTEKILTRSETKLSEIAVQLPSTTSEIESEEKIAHKPVDLYKAIFSDDSDDGDEEDIARKDALNAEKKIEGTNITLNRLVAGDFLESLGKELGLEVPTDASLPSKKSNQERLFAEQNVVPSNSDKTKTASTDDQIGSGTIGEKYDEEAKKPLLQGDEGDPVSPKNGSILTVASGPDGDYYPKYDATKMKNDATKFPPIGHKIHSRNKDYSSSTSDSESSHDHRSRRSKIKTEKRKHSSQRKRRHSRHHYSSSDDFPGDHRTRDKMVRIEKMKTEITSKNNKASRHNGHSCSDIDSPREGFYGSSSSRSKSSKTNGSAHSKHHRRHRRSSRSDHGDDRNNSDVRYDHTHESSSSRLNGNKK